MLELLKKFGMPATVSAFIAMFVTVVPLLFKVDNRYAKEDDVREASIRTEKALNAMTIEIGKLAGSQEALVAIIARRDSLRAQIPRALHTTPLKSIAPQAPVSVAPTGPIELSDVRQDLQRQQVRLQAFKY
jgi:outer membrane protein TolC